MNLSNKRRSWFFFFSPPVAKRFATVRPNEYDPGDVRLQYSSGTDRPEQ